LTDNFPKTATPAIARRQRELKERAHAFDRRGPAVKTELQLLRLPENGDWSIYCT
jgi:hypothetical protein